MLFVAELLSGFGVMVLDISIGSVFAAVIPEGLRARVTGAYTLVNYGVRPLGSLAGGALGTTIGMRPTLWIATLGAVTGVVFALPSRRHDAGRPNALAARPPRPGGPGSGDSQRYRPERVNRALVQLIVAVGGDSGRT